MEGFTQNGIHSSEMKVYYVPDANARGDFFADYEVLDLSRSWNPGGEYFHTRVKTRIKELDCYYEQVTLAEREKILKWLDRRTSGELIFDNREYAAYFVRPTKKIEFKDQLQNKMGEKLYSGTFTITFSAYDPFADLIWESIDGHENDEWAIEETGLMPASFTPPAVKTGDTACMIYNPGTEIGHSIIRFAGKTGSSDFQIYNAATGDKFILKAGLETGADEYYEIFSETGRVVKHSGNSSEVDFMFHDEGQITFTPFGSIRRNVEISTTAGSKTIKSADAIFDWSMVGQYIFADGEWRYISDIVSSIEANVNVNMSKTATEITNIVTMNYLAITKANDAQITRLEIICKAEVR